MQVDISGITVLTHNRATSIRLYREYKRKHPKQSPQWVVQKVIYDLERDRRISNPKILPVRTRRGSGNRARFSNQKHTWLTIGLAIASTLAYGINNGRPIINSSQFQAAYTLEAPNLSRQLDSTGAIVTIQNEAPEPVKVTLKQPETEVVYSFELPAYPKGRYYFSSETMPQECSKDAPVRSIPVQPGTYEATMEYGGKTRTERGMWTMVDRWEQFGCYFSIHHDNDDYVK